MVVVRCKWKFVIALLIDQLLRNKVWRNSTRNERMRRDELRLNDK